MSNLMDNNMVLLTELLPLERQVVLAQGFKGHPESLGFVSLSLDNHCLDENPRYQQE
jgi:hypothetical protein